MSILRPNEPIRGRFSWSALPAAVVQRFMTVHSHSERRKPPVVDTYVMSLHTCSEVFDHNGQQTKRHLKQTRDRQTHPPRHDVTYRRATSHEIKPPYLCVCIKYLCDLIPQRPGLTLYVPINSIPPSFSVPSDQIKANEHSLARRVSTSSRRTVADSLPGVPLPHRHSPTFSLLFTSFPLAPVPTENALLLLPHGVWLIGEAALPLRSQHVRHV